MHIARDAGGGLLGLAGQGRVLVVDHHGGNDPHLQKDQEEDVQELPFSDLLQDRLHCDRVVASHLDDLIIKRRFLSCLRQHLDAGISASSTALGTVAFGGSVMLIKPTK